MGKIDRITRFLMDSPGVDPTQVISLTHPTEIKEGMVFALETYCPATDGYSAARIEEEVVVTDKGCRVITLFPAEELPISHRY